MMYGSWDMACMRQTEFFLILDYFLFFYPLTMQKIKILKKWKKRLEISSFHTSAPQMKIISSMIPDIWSVTGRIFCHFELLFTPLTHWQPKKSKFWKNETNTWRYHHFTPVYQKSWSYATLFLRYGTTDNYFSFWGIFSPFTPVTAQKIKVLKKWKKAPGDIIILHTCTKKLWFDDVWFLWYGVRQMDRWTDRQMDGLEKWNWYWFS